LITISLGNDSLPFELYADDPFTVDFTSPLVQLLLVPPVILFPEIAAAEAAAAAAAAVDEIESGIVTY
jgi:hypothetical protein